MSVCVCACVISIFLWGYLHELLFLFLLLPLRLLLHRQRRLPSHYTHCVIRFGLLWMLNRCYFIHKRIPSQLMNLPFKLSHLFQHFMDKCVPIYRHAFENVCYYCLDVIQIINFIDLITLRIGSRRVYNFETLYSVTSSDFWFLFSQYWILDDRQQPKWLYGVVKYMATFNLDAKWNWLIILWKCRRNNDGNGRAEWFTMMQMKARRCSLIVIYLENIQCSRWTLCKSWITCSVTNNSTV